MKQIVVGLVILLTLAELVNAQTNFKIGGWCEQGGAHVTTQGLVSSTTVQQSFGACAVTVFQAGTLTPATIFSDGAGTPKANPFTAASTGYWSFYVPTSSLYDVRLSGGGITSPFTLSDLISPGTGGGTGTVTSITAGTGLSGGVITTTGTVSINQAASLTWTGIETFGNGTMNGVGLPTGVNAPSLAAFTRGATISGSTSTSPAVTFSSISNAAYVPGSGQFYFYGLKNNNAPMEVVSIQARQAAGITAGGGLVGQYIRLVNDVVGDATTSHFAFAASAQKYVGSDSDTSAELDIQNESGANASFSYGTQANRAIGLIIASKDPNATAKKITVAQVISADSAASAFYTGIDIRPGSIDTSDVTNGFRAIVWPNGTSLYARNGAGTGVVNIIGVNGADVLVWAAGGNLSQFSGNVQLSGALYLFLGTMTFAQLGAPANGATVYCTDCNATCTAGASTGRTCFRENGAWIH